MKTNSISDICQVAAVRSMIAIDTPYVHFSLLVDSFLHGQTAIFRTLANEPIGYVAWISVTKETLTFIERSRILPPYAYEWSDGRLMLIYDVAFVPGWNKVARDQLVRFLRKQKSVFYFKGGRVGCLRKSRLERYLVEKAKY